MRRIWLLFLLCLFLVRCAAAPPVTTKDSPSRDRKGSVETEAGGPREDRKDGLMVSLKRDGELQSSPYILAEDVKIIPQHAKVFVKGYEEGSDEQGYLLVEYGKDRGYMSTVYVTVDNRVKQFIRSEKQKIYVRNLNIMKTIKNNQREIESARAWVKPILATIRTLPIPESTIKDSLERGSLIFLQEEEDGWYRVLYNGPVIDFKSSDYADVAHVANSYEDPDDLVAAYMDGWIEESEVSDIQIEEMSEDERRRRIFIEENPDLFHVLRDAVLNGEIIIGMTKEMVTASWGTADEVSRSDFSTHEEWIYGDTYLFFEEGILNAWQNFDE